MIVFFLVVLSLIPAAMVGLGVLWRRHAPRTINSLYGYRTARSMKSQAAWDFAHQYAGAIWLRTGLPLWLVSLALLFAFRNHGIDELGRVVQFTAYAQVACLLLVIAPTEAALKRRFDDSGQPK